MDKKNKKKSKWLKAPLFISIAVVVPVSLYVVSYLASSKYHGFNTFYNGEEVSFAAETINFNRVEKRYHISSRSQMNNYQGGAVYDGVYFLCANFLENILMYDLETGLYLDCIDTSDYFNNQYHCNNICFGSEYYYPTDEFPILYISMEHANVHSLFAYRIKNLGTFYSVDEVQQIEYDAPKVSGIYYSNSYIDNENKKIIYSGYTQNSFTASADNYLKYFIFDLPEIDDGDFVHLSCTDEGVTTFTLPSETATQGAFIDNGIMVQSYGLKEKPVVKIIDIYNHKILKTFDDIGELGVYDEFENIVTYNDRIYGYGYNKMCVFEFSFNAEPKDDYGLDNGDNTSYE